MIERLSIESDLALNILIALELDVLAIISLLQFRSIRLQTVDVGQLLTSEGINKSRK